MMNPVDFIRGVLSRTSGAATVRRAVPAGRFVAMGAGALCAGLLAQSVAVSQDAPGDVYQLPGKAILDILDAPALPSGMLSPKQKWYVITERDTDEQTIAKLAEPTITLAGSRIKPNPDGRIENIGITRITMQSLDGKITRVITPPSGGFIDSTSGVRDIDGLMAYTVILNGAMTMHWYDAATDMRRDIAIPASGKIGGMNLTRDGKYMSFTMTANNEVTQWLVDMKTFAAKKVEGVTLNHVAGGCSWIKGLPPLLCSIAVDNRGAPPANNDVPTGPIVQESYGRAAPVRTYQNLLKSPADEALFDYYYTRQVAFIDVDGKVRRIGKPGIHSVSPSPNGEYLLVTTTHRPYSYQVGAGEFPKRTALWNMNGEEIKLLKDQTAVETAPSARDAVVPGVRSIGWRAELPATLMLVEALDGGDPEKPVPKRDRVSMWDAPFTGSPVTYVETEMRFRGLSFMLPDFVLLSEGSARTAKTKTWILNPQKPGSAPRLLWDRSAEDKYSDPGMFVMTDHPTELRSIPLRAPDGSLYLQGAGESAQGARPFLDRFDPKTLKATRLWQSSPPNYEQIVKVLDPKASRLVITRESATQRPNQFLYDVKSKKVIRQLSDFPDPSPWFAQVKGELVRYKREDGIDLSATLYLPPGYDAKRDGRLPFFVWAYPREFLTAAGASQISGSPHQFKRPAREDHLLLLTQGYGVLDGPAMPIVGKDGKEPNDFYVEQLVSSAKAAVDFLVERGLADRHRIGVGGHSYGAFMTANLLAHSDLFRAGIARSGAYNRTLTPFGFQAEPRTYWQAPDIYTKMSPFMSADKIKTPILLIHGMRDSNPGTFPIQSERLFGAIKGNGGNVRYVQLPLEDHGYGARESSRHVMWEMVTWLDKYVKNASPDKTTAAK